LPKLRKNVRSGKVGIPAGVFYWSEISRKSGGFYKNDVKRIIETAIKRQKTFLMENTFLVLQLERLKNHI
jgi:hypothetical protein